ncbi:hypothetical protein BV20DRAFT_1116256 [Pilatotrama ljubarskyi]|nr:hypothetical protein BV20DRAFT_1116256 [Pilatotrama ljubarskyi]
MAQPLFEQHPLEEYFRQTGEFAEPMPGCSPDFVPEQEDSLDIDDPSSHGELHLPELVVRITQLVNSLIQSASSHSPENDFAERFKYDVISSSLLASSLAAAPSSAVRRTFSPEIPGKLDGGGGFGEDNSASVDTKSDDVCTLQADFASPLDPLAPQLPYALVSLAVLALSTSYSFLAVLLLCGAAYIRYVLNTGGEKSDTAKQTLESLNELICAGNVWDSAVNEAMMLIENEERSIFYGPTSSQAPSSALRLALQSSLQTTQTQCDNVRQLLSALTSPTSLSQLAEIPANKRATWNGSYAALALSGSPTAHFLKRKSMNRRSDLASLFQPLPATSSVSAPVSPQPPSPATHSGLEDVTEEDDEPASELESKGYFGAAALALQRKRRSAGFEAFGIPPPPSYASSAELNLTEPPQRSPARSSHTRSGSGISPTFSSSSRLTSVHTTRHPLSLSGLHLALQGALSAKRYTCSHLLALRFNEDEDDTYWEDVRSIMALLTSTFADASARLVEALDDAEKRRIKDEHPTPPTGPSPLSRDSSVSPLRNEMGGGERKRARLMTEMISFAPMPSNMSRFGAHVDAISGALNDARDHLEECVASLRDASSRRQSLDMHEGTPSVQDHPAFQAYDRLRKELGFALRECERGRERLLDILAGPRSATEGAEDEDASPNTPGLKQDSGSESSEKGPVSPSAPLGLRAGDAGLGLELTLGRPEAEGDLDDATTHLLLTASSEHLPPPGAEQVFEAESGGGAPFTRERSKLSREERIKLAKARRASGLSSIASSEGGEARPRGERWGPGGEVVQELKDVIWKVGEKRRKLSERMQPVLPEPEDGDTPISEAIRSELEEKVAEEPASASASVREHWRPEPIDTHALRTELPASVPVAVQEGAAEEMS